MTLAFMSEAVCIAGLHNVSVLAALPAAGGETWLALSNGCELAAVDLERRTRRLIGRVDTRCAGDDGTLTLIVSADGGYAAVLHEGSSDGMVVDLATGTTLMRLHRGTYRVDNSAWPCAFVGTGAETVLVTATDWNRLDAFALPAGRLLTSRAIDKEHELDYFHGRLHVSPDQRWLVDTGWAWQPVSMPLVVDLDAWLGGSTFAADAPARRLFCDLDLSWDMAACWLDEHTFCLQGLPALDDDRPAQPELGGVTCFDVTTATEVRRFGGPPNGGYAVQHGPGRWRALGGVDSTRLFHDDGVLFSSTLTHGLSAWDPVGGVRCAERVELAPRYHHPLRREFLTVRAGDWLLATRWSRS